MVSEVILHIGMQKTGSRSIQTARSGYDDGRALYVRFPESNHSSTIQGTFSTRPQTYHQWQKLALDCAEIQRRCKKCREQLDTDSSVRETAPTNIDEWLVNLNDIDPEPRQDRLRQIGVNSTGKSFDCMLNRLYYQHLAEGALRQRQFRIFCGHHQLVIVERCCRKLFRVSITRHMATRRQRHPKAQVA